MSRSERRRATKRQGTPDPSNHRLFGRREVIGVALLAVGVLGTIGAVTLFANGGGDDTEAPAATFSPTTPDDFAIEALARRSIEVLPAGQWPSLFDDFTEEFRARCPREEFVAGGETNATELGTQLQLLGYVRLEDVVYSGDAATAVIVGELRGQSEYTVGSAFQRVDGAWKLAPAAGTQGCAAFNRLTDASEASPAQ